MHPHDIKEFFDKLRLSETKMLGNLPIERLTAMQERVKLLNELEHYVSTLPEAIKTKPRK